MSPTSDDWTAERIRKWYHKHGLEYDKEAWGPRSETGESATPQVQQPERSPGKGGSTSVRSTDPTPERQWWWEKQHFPWRPRGADEKRWVHLLDDFFAPYIAMLPRPKGNLVTQVYGEQRTYAEVGEEAGIARQSAHEAVQRAVRDLTRLIADDDPLFHPPTDGRRRDYDEEARAARRVFMVYLATQGIRAGEEEA